MKTTYKVTQSHFLNDAQKKIKQEIMEKLLLVVPNVIQQHANVSFSEVSLFDLILSCLIMFCREILISLISQNTLQKEKDLNDFIDTILKEIKDQIFRRIK